MTTPNERLATNRDQARTDALTTIAEALTRIADADLTLPVRDPDPRPTPEPDHLARVDVKVGVLLAAALAALWASVSTLLNPPHALHGVTMWPVRLIAADAAAAVLLFLSAIRPRVDGAFGLAVDHDDPTDVNRVRTWTRRTARLRYRRISAGCWCLMTAVAAGAVGALIASF